MLRSSQCCGARQLLHRTGCLLPAAAAAAAAAASLCSAAELPKQLRKDLLDALEQPQFGPQAVEPAQRLWQHCQQREAAKATGDNPATCAGPDLLLLLPPPNVTGRLHMGHALAFVIQDVLLRSATVRGANAKWLPGFDHAGIATQVLLERRIHSELGVTRHQVGRRQFVRRAEVWADDTRRQIRQQLQQLGLSLDWSEEYYTMDERHCDAVTEAFVQLHEAGLVHRDERLVNWSCSLQSAISDIEVEWKQLSGSCRLPVPGHQEPVQFGLLHELEYPLEDQQQQQQQQQPQSVVVATTRPETALGDTAVAVHPDDARWSSLIGRRARHPITGRLLPIVADTEVDASFGTGAVKVTPGHSRQDLRLADRHGLERVSVFDASGCVLPEIVEPFAGRPRFEARELLLQRLRQLRLYRGCRQHAMALPLCSRSGDVVEQLLREQWFLRCSPDLTQAAAGAVADGSLRILPPGFAGEWQEWMRRTDDWCLSRQIWWGHRIPAYEALDSSGRSLGWVVGRSASAASASAAGRWGSGVVSQLRQDPDVLDTWFSSALLPLSLAGWPRRLDERRFPLTLLETGHDILFFWVARMVMLSQRLLRGRLPFDTVLLNGLICDSGGRKMSKSRGNVLDPLQLMQAGPDPLRLALCCHRFQLEQVSFDHQWVSASGRFLNKLWQSQRLLRRHFASQQLEGSDPRRLLCELRQHSAAGDVDKVDAWLLSRCAALAADCWRAGEQLQLQDSANRLKQFWTAEFCDVFLECLKVSRRPEVAAKVAFVASCLFLQQLYPYCPHTAEVLWLGLRPQDARLVAAEPLTPEALADWRSLGAEEIFGFVLQLLRRLQDWRQLLRPEPGAQCRVLYNSGTCPIDASQYWRLFERLARAPLQPLLAPEADDSQLLRLELCEGLQFAAKRPSLRLDAASLELQQRLQKQRQRQQRLLRLGAGISESQQRKLLESQEQEQQLLRRIDELTAGG